MDVWVVIWQSLDAWLELHFYPFGKFLRQPCGVVHADSPLTNQGHELIRDWDGILTEVQKVLRNIYEWSTSILRQIRWSNVKSVPVLLPRAIWILAIEVVATAIFPRSSKVRLFLSESLIIKVRLHLDAACHLHDVEEAVPSEPSYPIAILKTRPLMIRCTYGHGAPAPEGVWSKPCVIGENVRAKFPHRPSFILPRAFVLRKGLEVPIILHYVKSAPSAALPGVRHSRPTPAARQKTSTQP